MLEQNSAAAAVLSGGPHCMTPQASVSDAGRAEHDDTIIPARIEPGFPFEDAESAQLALHLHTLDAGDRCDRTEFERTESLGPYRLRHQIGEGAFGHVYLAEQLKPIRRKVAIKILKPGMCREVSSRFAMEPRALALLDHSNIPRLIDVGETGSGQSYFVMELVQGVSITEFCDKHRLSTRARLDLFVEVCGAIQHAHNRGIIHRDVKPANVMVTLIDGQPVIKVIDYGVSKAVNQPLTENGPLTEYGQMVGTPVYMSPEQAEMSGLGIDERTDVYSLGVLLYELLTGVPPIDAKRLREGGVCEMLRIIREEEALRPSLKISTLSGKQSTTANQLHTNPARLRQVLRGDLDRIVLKALEKNRVHRYDSANSLAVDINRFLNGEPVEAGRPSLANQLTNSLRRKWSGIVKAGAFVAGVLVGLAVASW